MTEQERSKIAFEWVFACVIIHHCQRQQALNKISAACAYLTRKGILERVGRGRYRSKQQPKDT